MGTSCVSAQSIKHRAEAGTLQHGRNGAGRGHTHAPAKSWVTGVEGARMRKPSSAVWKLMAAREGQGGRGSEAGMVGGLHMGTRAHKLGAA